LALVGEKKPRKVVNKGIMVFGKKNLKSRKGRNNPTNTLNTGSEGRGKETGAKKAVNAGLSHNLTSQHKRKGGGGKIWVIAYEKGGWRTLFNGIKGLTDTVLQILG